LKNFNSSILISKAFEEKLRHIFFTMKQKIRSNILEISVISISYQSMN